MKRCAPVNAERPTRRTFICEGKEVLTFHIAQKLARDMRRRGRLKIEAYHCPFCRAWHVGNQMSPRLHYE
jgi:hypothetical protein